MALDQDRLNALLGKAVGDLGATAYYRAGTEWLGPLREGVLDPDLRLFGTRNVHVGSCSVFPSSGFATPTHTLLAPAVRLAWHLKDLPAQGTMKAPLRRISI